MMIGIGSRVMTTSAVPSAEPVPAATPAPPKPRRRRRWLRRLVTGVVAGLLTLSTLALGLVAWSVGRAFPQHDGELALPGLSAPVAVYRDQYGIPQLYASSAHDLFMAQGFVHAQDRFWEMDFRRHVTAGRLSELFGESQVPTDAFIRTLGWRHVAEQELTLISAEARGYLQAYADGVNAWLDQNGGAEPTGSKSLEYTLLGLLTSGYTIEPWTPVDSLAWLKAMAWDLRGNMESEIGRALLLASGLSRQQVEELYPTYPYDLNEPIVSRDMLVAEGVVPPEPEDPTADADATVTALTEAGPALAALARAIDGLPTLLGDGGAGIGSNSWVISGEHTTTGKPLLANDPHLSPSMPGIWYQIGLHCSCAFNVEGFSFSGVPGVVIGHTDRTAWGFTNLDPDVTDLYLEQIQDGKSFDGSQWVPLTTREEVITVAGGEPVTITVRSTKHGPLLSDRSSDLLTIASRPNVDKSGEQVGTVAAAPEPSLDPASPGVPDAANRTPYGVALRWTALDPGRTVEALFAIDRSTDWESFRAAAALFEVPAQNLIYADVDGNIGYQSPGRVPVRGKGDGTWPVPGWDPDYDWQGFIDFDDLPRAYNPARGWIVTANQAVVDESYPRLLTKDWSYGFRSQRIAVLIEQRLSTGKIDAEAIRQIQFDNGNILAPALIAQTQQLPGRPAAASLLDTWDYQQTMDSAAAALYNVFWRHLLTRTFDELPADLKPDGESRWWVVVSNLLDQPTSPWWDDRSTSAIEHRDEILSAALADAVAELESAQGKDFTKWRWGALHTLTLTHASFGSSGVAPIEWLFNRGPFETAGGAAIVNANGWDAADGYEVDSVPSMRMILDLSNWDASRWIQLTGNSGHAFHPNYADQFPLWQVGENLPMLWDRSSIEGAATHTLALIP